MNILTVVELATAILAVFHNQNNFRLLFPTQLAGLHVPKKRFFFLPTQAEKKHRLKRSSILGRVNRLSVDTAPFSFCSLAEMAERHNAAELLLLTRKLIDDVQQMIET